jgi:hypothetical protein
MNQQYGERRRVELDFGPQTIARLERLVEVTEASSYGEVVRNALQLYAGIIDEGGLNVRLVVPKADGSAVIFRVLK